MTPDVVHLRTTATTILAGGLGAVLFELAGLPVPWLSGSMIFVALLAIAGVPISLPALWRDFGLIVSGVALGSTITPEALATVARYPLSLIGLVCSLAATIYGSKLILQKLFHWDAETAFLASVPGAMSTVLVLAAESGADARRVAVVQGIRLLALVAVTPTLISATSSVASVAPSDTVSAGGMGFVFLASFVFAEIMARFRAANPLFLGGMVVGMVLHITGLVHGALPLPLINAGMLLVGIYCGLRFEGTSLRFLGSLLVPSLAALLAALAVSLCFSVAINLVTGLRFAEVIVALAPGGVEAMILLGAAMGLDTLYISTHHVVRTVVLNMVTPFFSLIAKAD